jgi:hypothetical protein
MGPDLQVEENTTRGQTNHLDAAGVVTSLNTYGAEGRSFAKQKNKQVANSVFREEMSSL